jgi:hypothetical protein
MYDANPNASQKRSWKKNNYGIFLKCFSKADLHPSLQAVQRGIRTTPPL